MPQSLGGNYNFAVPVGTDPPAAIKDLTDLAKAIDPLVLAASKAYGPQVVELSFRTDSVGTILAPVDAASGRLQRYGKLVTGVLKLKNTTAYTINAGSSNVSNVLFANFVKSTDIPISPAVFTLSLESAATPLIAACAIDGGGFYVEHVHSRSGDSTITVAANSLWYGSVVYMLP